MEEKEKLIEKIEFVKQAVEKMKTDDIEESPESAYEEFQCGCCGEAKILAGSIIYKDFRLCNDCVLLAETGFALGKMNDIEDLIQKMESKRFEEIYKSIFTREENSMN